MSEDKWHQLWQVEEAEFDQLEPKGLVAYPVYYCVRANGSIEFWPRPENIKRRLQLAWCLR